MKPNKKKLLENISELKRKKKNLLEVAWEYGDKLKKYEKEYDKHFIPKHSFFVTYYQFDGELLNGFEDGETVLAKDYEDAIDKTVCREWSSDSCVEYAIIKKETGPNKYFRIEMGCEMEWGEVYSDPITSKEMKDGIRQHLKMRKEHYGY